jgi:hypothetical protein
MSAALVLALSLAAAPPAEVKLHFREAPAAERVVLGTVVVTVADLKAGVTVDDDALLRALRVEAARSDADAVLEVKLGTNAAGQPTVQGVLAREGRPRHGVRTRSGVVLFFRGEGMPPRGDRVRDVEARASELPSGASASRAALIRALARKARALGGDALALVEVVEERDRVARGVVIKKARRASPAPVPSKKGVRVDDGWYDVPPEVAPPPPPTGDAPPDPADG